jgi:hypothetical protein
MSSTNWQAIAGRSWEVPCHTCWPSHLCQVIVIAQDTSCHIVTASCLIRHQHNSMCASCSCQVVNLKAMSIRSGVVWPGMQPRHRQVLQAAHCHPLELHVAQSVSQLSSRVSCTSRSPEGVRCRLPERPSSVHCSVPLQRSSPLLCILGSLLELPCEADLAVARPQAPSCCRRRCWLCLATTPTADTKSEGRQQSSICGETSMRGIFACL